MSDACMGWGDGTTAFVYYITCVRPGETETADPLLLLPTMRKLCDAVCDSSTSPDESITYSLIE